MTWTVLAQASGFIRKFRIDLADLMQIWVILLGVATTHELFMINYLSLHIFLYIFNMNALCPFWKCIISLVVQYKAIAISDSIHFYASLLQFSVYIFLVTPIVFVIALFVSKIVLISINRTELLHLSHELTLQLPVCHVKMYCNSNFEDMLTFTNQRTRKFNIATF